MFRNYISTALRNMRKEKIFSALNITGLAIGIGCGLVIYSIINYELSYDKHHSQYSNIYRLISEYDDPAAGHGFFEGQVHPLGEALRNDFPGLDAVMTFYAAEGQITVGEGGNAQRYKETSGIAYVEPNFFSIFDFKFIAGDPVKALKERGSVVITESLARKYFHLGSDQIIDAIGKTMQLNGSLNLAVTAVVADTPGNTDLPFTLMANYQDQFASNPYFNQGKDWQEFNSATNCYLLLKSMSAESLASSLRAFQSKFYDKNRLDHVSYVLQQLKELHYDSRCSNYNHREVNYSRLMVMAIIGIFLVLTASINFVNLSTAQAVKRSKEIGVRKALGGNRSQLVFQFLGETIMISFISAIVGLGVAQLLFTNLDPILGYQLRLDSLLVAYNIAFAVGLIVLVGLLSGIYPALVMARLNPIKALKSSVASSDASGLLSVRRGLVVVQFVISQALIIGTIVIYQQMNYFMTADIGFSKDSIISAKLPSNITPEKLETFKNNLMSHSGVEMVTYSVSNPMASWRVINNIIHPKLDPNESNGGNLKTADENYIRLYKLKLIAGRDLPQQKDTKEAVVNRKLTKLLGYTRPEDALGDKFGYGRNGLEFTIIGVVEDFNTVSLHQSMEYTILSNLPWNIREIGIKLAGGNSIAGYQAVVENIRNEWDKVFPETIFDYAFLDQQIADMYADEAKTSKLIQLFSIIAIVIGCMGLYGLVSYVATQKTKEIGVRKVLGATVFNILGIFSKEMLILIGIAFLIASPLAWYVTDQWLQGFQFRVNISPIWFAIAVAITILIAFVTISYRAILASLANPINSLRSE